MSTSVARSHGGDNGGEPPRRNSDRIPNTCEASQTKKRSKGKSLNLFKKFKDNNGQKLPIEFDDEENQYRFVGENESMIVRLISGQVDKYAPKHYLTWKKVPDCYKRKIYPVIWNYFKLDHLRETEHWEGIKAGIEAECRRSYKDWKSDLKTHFINVGGKQDSEAAKKRKPSHISPEEWVKVVDMFSDPDYQKRCEQNKKNRAKHPYTSSHGSQSLAQKRYINSKKTGKSGHLDVWYDAHCKNGVWVNKKAENDWYKIQEIATNMRDEEDGEDIDEVACLKQALGVRRGHVRGVGRTIKSVTPDFTSTSYVPASQLTEMQQKWEEQQKLNEEQQKVNQEMQNQLAQLLAMVNKQSGSSRHQDESGSSRQHDEDDESD